MQNYSGSIGLRNAVGEKSCTDPLAKYDDDSNDVARARATPRVKESADTISSMTSTMSSWKTPSSDEAKVVVKAAVQPQAKGRAVKEADVKTQWERTAKS